ncbi:MAG TPA: KpsF/GutQ family sugar-phosphate isomerase [Phycisphaerae bacterium]|nr:KpsF/GutQ family sugar-phosphate isomerase [Phycisphaerae bacterium]HNU44701.1 KpsF/GutQ family sugar-phosphate isomerase [Phycisphaerae bacterium]
MGTIKTTASGTTDPRGARPAVDTSGPAASPSGTAGRSAGILARGQTVLHMEANAILDARGRLGDNFIEAVETIIACRGRVCVTGVGKAGLIGAKIQATLASTGTLSYSLHPVEALHGDLGMIHADDVVLALSKSGGSELVELLPRLRQLGCRIILLTAAPDSPAARQADVVLDIGRSEEACPLGLAPSSSTTAMLALGDALALTVMELKDIRPEQYARYHPGGALGRYLMKAGEIMRTGADCPTVSEEATLGTCYEVMLAAPRRAGAAMVVDAAGHLVGIVTHGDFFRLFTRGQAGAGRQVASVMTRNPKCVRVDERVMAALQLMRQHAIDELPVVDAEGNLAGMIDIQDLLARGFSLFDNR